jgi:hypothetical protein
MLIFVLLFVFPGSVLGEKVKPLNPDCDVCPVVICYDGEEAKGILGKEGAKLLLKLSTIQKKISKIDLDGVKKPGSENEDNEGYELLVFIYPNMIAINFISDSSAIKIQTDSKNLAPDGVTRAWAPEIYLSPHYAPIKKDDDIKTAWGKVKESSLYQYVNNNKKEDRIFNNNLRELILHVLKAVAS